MFKKYTYNNLLFREQSKLLLEVPLRKNIEIES